MSTTSPNDLPALDESIETFLTEQSVNDETRYIARKYYPTSWGKTSPHLPSGIPVMTWDGLFMHARGEEAARVANARTEDLELRNSKKKRQAKTAEQSAEWVEWHRQCAARKAWIESKNAEWRKRVALMKEQVHQWERYVEEARAEFQAAKLVPVPTQPGK